MRDPAIGKLPGFHDAAARALAVFMHDHNAFGRVGEGNRRRRLRPRQTGPEQQHQHGAAPAGSLPVRPDHGTYLLVGTKRGREHWSAGPSIRAPWIAVEFYSATMGIFFIVYRRFQRYASVRL